MCDDSFRAYLVIGPRLARRTVRGRRWNDAAPGDVHDMAGKEDSRF